MKKRFISFLFLSSLLAFSAYAQVDKSFVDRIKVMGYGQFGYSAKFEDKIGNTNSFNINKVEVLGLGKINHHWDMGITFQIHGTPMLKDLFLRYTIAPELRLKIGQFKTPFGIENNIAPFLNPLIIGASNPTIYFAGIAGNPYYYGTAGRDMGLDISGDIMDKLFSYRAVILNGRGMNYISTINPKLYGGSISVRPISVLRLHTSYLGGSIDTMNGSGVQETHRVSAGVHLSTPSVSVLGEYMWGVDGDQKGHGAYITTSIHLPKRFDIIIGGDYLNTDLAHKDKDIYTATLGLTQWFYGSCRWQIEYQYRTARNDAHFLDISTQGHKLAGQVQFVF